MSKIQKTFNSEDILLRPTYTEGDFKKINFHKVNKDEIKDYNWFYVEYYGNIETFNEIKRKLISNKLLKGKHTIDPDWFQRVVENEI